MFCNDENGNFFQLTQIPVPGHNISGVWKVNFKAIEIKRTYVVS